MLRPSSGGWNIKLNPLFRNIYLLLNKGLSLTSQPPEEGQSVQRLKRCDKHGGKDEDNSPKNLNNVYLFIYLFILNKKIIINNKWSLKSNVVLM